MRAALIQCVWISKLILRFYVSTIGYGIWGKEGEVLGEGLGKEMKEVVEEKPSEEKKLFQVVNL